MPNHEEDKHPSDKERQNLLYAVGVVVASIALILVAIMCAGGPSGGNESALFVLAISGLGILGITIACMLIDRCPVSPATFISSTVNMSKRIVINKYYFRRSIMNAFAALWSLMVLIWTGYYLFVTTKDVCSIIDKMVNGAQTDDAGILFMTSFMFLVLLMGTTSLAFTYWIVNRNQVSLKEELDTIQKSLDDDC